MQEPFDLITVSLNPALDVTLSVGELDFEERNKTKGETVYAGGKAINVSRVLTSLGIANRTIGLAGKDNFPALDKLLDEDNVQHQFFPIPGSIRENLTICLADGKVLKINRQGPDVPNAALEKLQRFLSQLLDKDDRQYILAFCGGTPPNLSVSQYKDFIASFQRDHVRIVLDSDVFSCQEILSLAPFCIKPNRIEFAKMLGKGNPSFDELLSGARMLAENVPHILLSLGADGLLYIHQQEAYWITVPPVKVKTTIGAGDTTLAGFLAALQAGQSYETAARYAAACGTASVQLEGTGAVTPAQVMEILPLVHSRKL